jgi:hypothetical protein
MFPAGLPGIQISASPHGHMNNQHAQHLAAPASDVVLPDLWPPTSTVVPVFLSVSVPCQPTGQGQHQRWALARE